jgi:hypothetical protein
MTKEQCLKELPPLTNILHDVPVSSRYQFQYEKAIKELVSLCGLTLINLSLISACSGTCYLSLNLEFVIPTG